MANRNRPSCDMCGHLLVKNGKTAAGTQRWLCPQCNASSINTRAHTSEIRRFKIFIDWILSGESADHLATRRGVTRRTLTRWFTLLWFITMPTATDPYRVYDQVFIDGGPDPRKVDTSGASYAAVVSIAEVLVSKTSGATRLHQEWRLRV
ncbi:hypothetical protein GWO58_03550, partial [Corynebacterium macginleyi]|nr:hypothetical protein [Corynebacterium macginleyi]